MTTIRTPIPPDLARKVQDVPVYGYPGAGPVQADGTATPDYRQAGTARLRIFDTTSIGWVAVLTGPGAGVPVAAAAPAIMRVLRVLLPASPVWLIEHMPPGADAVTGEHLYLHLPPGGTSVSHLWPALPVDENHPRLDQWMTRNGPVILEHPVPDPATFIRAQLAGGGNPWPGVTTDCPTCDGTGTVIMRGAARDGYDEPDYPDTCGICGGEQVVPVSMFNPYPGDEDAEDAADLEDDGDPADLELPAGL